MVSIVVLNQQNFLKEMPKNPTSYFFKEMPRNPKQHVLSLKHAAIELGFKNFSDAVKHGSILNCANNEWCSFMCPLGLSSVLKSQMHPFIQILGI